jgi:hypothetical protein
MMKNLLSPRLLKKVQMSLDFARDREPLSNGKAARAGPSEAYFRYAATSA